RLIENLTLGTAAVGYRTESMHGAGSPQAQRIQIARSMQIDFKKELAKTIAGIDSASRNEIVDDLSSYMARVFAPVRSQ
ncbi:MAG: 4-hydroxyphenylacetate 3-hydroxylase C-terminal domain-containing protein, partial [Candidatus Binatia bacterium]